MVDGDDDYDENPGTAPSSIERSKEEVSSPPWLDLFFSPAFNWTRSKVTNWILSIVSYSFIHLSDLLTRWKVAALVLLEPWKMIVRIIMITMTI